MASNSLALRFKMLGDASGLTKATRKGSKDLGAMGNASKKLSGILKGAFIGFSIAGVTSQLLEFSKAAAEDVRSSQLLSKTLENNIKGGAKYSAQVEDTIAQMSVMAAVTDDELRPSFAFLVKSTKSVEKSTKLMGIALDVAADSGISAEAASKALGKAYNGNLTALYKLYPALKKVKDPIAALEKQVKGMAALKGDNDPFGQMSILVNEAKEDIGKVLLPEIKKFAKYLRSEKGNKMITDVVSSIKDLVREGIKLGKWAMDNKGTLLGIAGVIAGLQVTNMAINSYRTLKTVWLGLAKAGKLISAPNVGGAGLPAAVPGKGGKVGGKAPTVVGGKPGKGGGLKFAAPSAAVAVSAAATAAVAVYGSTMVDLFNKDRKAFANEVKSQVARAKAYSPGGVYSATDLLVGGAGGVKRGAPVNPGAGGGNMANVTYKVVIENNNNTKITGREIIESIKAEARRRGQTSGVWNLGSL